MKFYVLVFLVFSSHLFSSDHHQLPTVEAESEFSHANAEDFWQNKFYFYLLDQDEIDIQLDGLQGLTYIWDEKNKLRVTEAFSNILAKTETNHPAYPRITGFCNETVLIPICAQYEVGHLLDIQDESNVIAHLYPMFQALFYEDQPRINALIQGMAHADKAQYDFERHRSLLYSYADAFVKMNKSAGIDQLWGDPGLMAFFKRIHSKYAQDVLSLNAYLEMMTAHKLAYETYRNGPFPPLKYIHVACADESRVEACQKIGRTMTAGNTLLIQDNGYLLLKTTALMSTDVKRMEDAVFAHARFTKYTTCLTSLPMELNNGQFHPAYLMAMLESYSKGENELQAQTRAAVAIDRAFKKAGIKTSYNPRHCKQILAMDNTAFLKKYSPEDSTLKSLKEIH